MFSSAFGSLFLFFSQRDYGKTARPIFTKFIRWKDGRWATEETMRFRVRVMVTVRWVRAIPHDSGYVQPGACLAVTVHSGSVHMDLAEVCALVNAILVYK